MEGMKKKNSTKECFQKGILEVLCKQNSVLFGLLNT